MEGKRQRGQLKKGRCRAGKDRGEMMAGGRQRRPLQGEKSCLCGHESPPHATKFRDLPRQMTMADPPLHGEEVSGEGKTMQNLYCQHFVSELKWV